MRSFNKDSKFSGSRGGGFGGRGGRDSGRPSFGARNSGGVTLHDAVCAECGKSCKVPFQPSGTRPVFCSDCFEKKDGGEPRAPRQNNFDRPAFSEKRSYSAPSAPSHRNQENDSKNFDQLNAKLDKILKTLNYIINKDAKPQEASLSEMVLALEQELPDETPVKAKVKKPRTKKAAK